jgi:hypothetical protein
VLGIDPIRLGPWVFAAATVWMLASCRPTVNDGAAAFDARAAIDAWLEAWNTRDLDRIDDLFVTRADVS